MEPVPDVSHCTLLNRWVNTFLFAVSMIGVFITALALHILILYIALYYQVPKWTFWTINERMIK